MKKTLLPLLLILFSFKLWGQFPFGQANTYEATNIMFLPVGISLGLAL